MHTIETYNISLYNVRAHARTPISFQKYQRRTYDKLTINDLNVIFQKMKCRFTYQQYY